MDVSSSFYLPSNLVLIHLPLETSLLKILCLELYSIFLSDLVYWYLVSWDLHIFCILNSLWGIELVKIFFHSLGSFFFLIYVIISLIEAFQYYEIKFIDYRSYNNCVYGILFRKTFPVPVCTTLYPTFIVSGFKLRFLIKFDLKFLQCDKYDCICILLYTDIQVDQYNLLKVLSFSGLYI